MAKNLVKRISPAENAANDQKHTGNHAPQTEQYSYVAGSLGSEWFGHVFEPVNRENTDESQKNIKYTNISFYHALKGIFFDGGLHLNSQKEILSCNYIDQINQKSPTTDPKYALVDVREKNKNIESRNKSFFDSLKKNMKIGELLSDQVITESVEIQEVKRDSGTLRAFKRSQVLSSASLHENGGITDITLSNRVDASFFQPKMMYLSKNIIICHGSSVNREIFHSNSYNYSQLQLHLALFSDGMKACDFAFHVTLFESKDSPHLSKAYAFTEEFYLEPLADNNKINKLNTVYCRYPKNLYISALVRVSRKFSNCKLKEFLKYPQGIKYVNDNHFTTIGFKTFTIQRPIANQIASRRSRAASHIGLQSENGLVMVDLVKESREFVFKNISKFDIGLKQAKKNSSGFPTRLSLKKGTPDSNQLTNSSGEPTTNGDEVLKSQPSMNSINSAESNRKTTLQDLKILLLSNHIDPSTMKDASKQAYKPQLFPTPFNLYRIPSENALYVYPLKLSTNAAFLKTAVVKVYCYSLKTSQNLNVIVNPRNPTKFTKMCILSSVFKMHCFNFIEQVKVILDAEKKFSTFLVFEICDHKTLTSGSGRKLFSWVPLFHQETGSPTGKMTLYLTEQHLTQYEKQNLSIFDDMSSLENKPDSMKLNCKNFIEVNFKTFSNLHSSHVKIDDAFVYNDNSETDIFSRSRTFSTKIYEFIAQPDKPPLCFDYFVVIDHLICQVASPLLKNDKWHSHMLLFLLIEFIDRYFGPLYAKNSTSDIQELLVYINMFSLSNMKKRSSSIFEKLITNKHRSTISKRDSFLDSETSLFECIEKCYDLIFDDKECAKQLKWMKTQIKVDRKMDELQNSAKNVKWFFNLIILKFGLVRKLRLGFNDEIAQRIIHFMNCAKPVFRSDHHCCEESLFHLGSLFVQLWILFSPEYSLNAFSTSIGILRMANNRDSNQQILRIIYPFITSKICINFSQTLNGRSFVSDSYFELIQLYISCLNEILQKNENEPTNFGFKSLKTFMLMLDNLPNKTQLYRTQIATVLKTFFDNYIEKYGVLKQNTRSQLDICFICFLRLDPDVCTVKDSVYNHKYSKFIQFLQTSIRIYNEGNMERTSDVFIKFEKTNQFISKSMSATACPSSLNDLSVQKVHRNVQRILLATLNESLKENLPDSIVVNKERINFLVTFSQQIAKRKDEHFGLPDCEIHMDLLLIWYKLGLDAILSENDSDEINNSILFHSDMLSILVKSASSTLNEMRYLASLLLVQLLTSYESNGILNHRIYLAVLCAFVNLVENKPKEIDFAYLIGSLKHCISVVNLKKGISMEIKYSAANFIKICIEVVTNIYWLNGYNLSKNYCIFLLSILQHRLENYMEVRLYILEKLKNLNDQIASENGTAESGMCLLHMSAIIIEYLNIWKINSFFNICATDLIPISHNLASEGANSDWTVSLQSHYADSRKKVFSIENVALLLAEAAQSFKNNSMCVIYYKVKHLLSTVFIQTGKFRSYSTQYKNVYENVSSLIPKYFLVTISLQDNSNYSFRFVCRNADSSIIHPSILSDIQTLTGLPTNKINIDITTLSIFQMKHSKFIYSSKEDAEIHRKTFYYLKKDADGKNMITLITSNYIFPYMSSYTQVLKSKEEKFDILTSSFLLIKSTKTHLKSLIDMKSRSSLKNEFFEQTQSAFIDVNCDDNVFDVSFQAYGQLTNLETKNNLIAQLNDLFKLYVKLYNTAENSVKAIGRGSLEPTAKKLYQYLISTK